jgi:hypothetical protein
LRFWFLDRLLRNVGCSVLFSLEQFLRVTWTTLTWYL